MVLASLTLFFFLVLAILGPWHFHLNFRITLSVLTVKKTYEILIGSVWICRSISFPPPLLFCIWKAAATHSSVPALLTRQWIMQLFFPGSLCCGFMALCRQQCFASFTQSPGMDSSFTASVFYKLLQYTHCICHFPCGKNLAAGWIWEMWLLGHNVYTFEILIDKLLRVLSIYIPTNNKIGGLFAIVSILHCQPFSFLLSW